MNLTLSCDFKVKLLIVTRTEIYKYETDHTSHGAVTCLVRCDSDWCLNVKLFGASFIVCDLVEIISIQLGVMTLLYSSSINELTLNNTEISDTAWKHFLTPFFISKLLQSKGFSETLSCPAAVWQIFLWLQWISFPSGFLQSPCQSALARQRDRLAMCF